MNYALDTNVLLRFFIRDEPAKAQKVRKIFEEAKKGNVHLLVETFIVIEFAYALSSYFKLTKMDICLKLQSLLTLSFLDIPERKEIAEAVEVYEHYGVDFIDALLFIKTRKKEKTAILSFDKDFDKLSPGLRAEPQ